MAATAKQVKYIQTMIGKLGLREEKATLVHEISGGKASHVNELSFSEASQLIVHLKKSSQSFKPKIKPHPNPPQREGKSQKMFNSIIRMGHQLGWKLESGKIDMSKINAWCMSHGYLHKPMNDYTHAELPRLVQQFTMMFEEYIKRFPVPSPLAPEVGMASH